MKVLITGGTGFIGTALAARLSSEGHEVILASRRAPNTPLIGATWRRIDLGTASPADWATMLEDVDAVVNCAGTFQNDPRNSQVAVHDQGPAALFAACETAGVRRVIHISGMGADRAVTGFTRSKRAGEEALKARNLDWIILRPSVVIDRAVVGSSALIRGLAALPVAPRLPETAALSVVMLEDVVAGIVRLLAPDAPSRLVLDVVGPEPIPFMDLVAGFRAWLGWSPAAVLPVPRILSGLIYRLGDLSGLLGWPSAIRTTARREMVAGAAADPAPWMAATGLTPTRLSAFLATHPAGVQDRQHARLYFLKPVAFLAFALLWIGTGVVSLGPGYAAGLALMGASPFAAPVVIAGGLADLAIGLGLLWRPTARWALLAGLAISAAYAFAGTAVRPELWIDPLGPLLKIAPLMALNLLCLNLLDDRR